MRGSVHGSSSNPASCRAGVHNPTRTSKAGRQRQQQQVAVRQGVVVAPPRLRQGQGEEGAGWTARPGTPLASLLLGVGCCWNAARRCLQSAGQPAVNGPVSIGVALQRGAHRGHVQLVGHHGGVDGGKLEVQVAAHGLINQNWKKGRYVRRRARAQQRNQKEAAGARGEGSAGAGSAPTCCAASSCRTFFWPAAEQQVGRQRVNRRSHAGGRRCCPPPAACRHVVGPTARPVAKPPPQPTVVNEQRQQLGGVVPVAVVGQQRRRLHAAGDEHHGGALQARRQCSAIAQCNRGPAGGRKKQRRRWRRPQRAPGAPRAPAGRPSCCAP